MFDSEVEPNWMTQVLEKITAESLYTKHVHYSLLKLYKIGLLLLQHWIHGTGR